jgi:mRNA interferase RelE/StbE
VAYRIELSPSAARELRTLNPAARRRVQAVAELLADDPRPPSTTRLVGGGGEWRVRTGDYRVVYAVEHDVLLVLWCGSVTVGTSTAADSFGRGHTLELLCSLHERSSQSLLVPARAGGVIRFRRR